MMRNLRLVFEVARQTLRLLAMSRFVWVVLLVDVGCAVIGWAITGEVHRRLDSAGHFAIVAWWFQVGLLIPFATMYFAVQAIASEIEDRTYQYLFLRPVPRGVLLAGKWLAACLLGALLGGVGLLLLFLGVILKGAEWNHGGPDWGWFGTFVLVGAAAATAYAAVAALFAVALRRPLLWSMAFVVGLQMFVAALPAEATLRKLTIGDPLRRMLIDRLEPDRHVMQVIWPAEAAQNRRRLPGPLEIQMQMMNVKRQRELEETIGQPELNLGINLAATLLLALFIYSRREYDSRARE